ncbi:peptidoglycan-binding domain-containing protein [Streptomyces sp. NPDC020298]|uniref:peptidoglycan-binding domain-containing protein n=1 Tax=unclassified Streptomyces TaxID=2593676 RepID=UPI0033C4A32D
MSTPHDQGGPSRGPVLEPIRVLRPRRLDALAELMREMEQDAARPETSPGPPGPDAVADPFAADVPAGPSAADAFADPSGPQDWARPPVEDDTEELPRVSDAPPGRQRRAARRSGAFGFGPGLRRAAVVVAVTAAALVGFACALLLPGRQETASAAQPSAPATSAAPTESAGTAPTAAATATADPDGAGTLREGDSGPEVTELEQRLLRIPDVYRDGSTSGTYDAGLTAAVARFQLWYGIRGDENGVYGDDTRRSLESRTSLATG